MARLKFGMVVTDMRGKLGGHVFTKSRQGATVRTKVTPVNRQTSAQGAIRGIFGTLSRGWNGLTEPQRATWNNAAEEFKRTNVFGDQVALSGKNLYISLNTNITTAGGVGIVVAPVDSSTPIIASFDVDVTHTPSSIDLRLLIPGVLSPKDVLIVEATMQNSAGRYNFSGQYRQIATCPADDIVDADTLAGLYVEKFGALRVGAKISFRAYIINRTTGFASPKVIASTIVAV